MIHTMRILLNDLNSLNNLKSLNVIFIACISINMICIALIYLGEEYLELIVVLVVYAYVVSPWGA